MAAQGAAESVTQQHKVGHIMSKGQLDPRIEARLQKLLALAERGVDGEKVTAQRMLQKLLNKHSLTIEDLLDDQVGDHEFKFKSADERTLLTQTVFKVLNKPTIRAGMIGKSLWVKCTQIQAVEISTHWEIYRREYKKQTRALLSAFIHTNQMYPDVTESDSAPVQMTPEQMEHIRATRNLMSSMNAVPIHRALPGGAG